MGTTNFELTPPELLTFIPDGEAAGSQLVRSAVRGPRDMAGFLLAQAVERLERGRDDPMQLEVALGMGNLSVTVAAYNTGRRPATDAPMSFVGAEAGIGQLVREGDTIKLGFQRPAHGSHPPAYSGITFRERHMADGATVWCPEKVWGLSDDGQPVIVDEIETADNEPPRYDSSTQEILLTPLPRAGKALYDGVVRMRKPTSAGAPKYRVDVTSGFLSLA